MAARRAPFLLVGAALLCGCPDPNIYGTPRTLNQGDLQAQASVGGYAGSTRSGAGFAPGLPSFGLRLGVVDRLDVGVRVVDFLALGGDAKYNFLRGRVDLAVDPTVQAFYARTSGSSTNDVGVFQFHVPLLVGFNFDDATTLLLVPGLVATAATSSAVASASDVSVEQVAFASSGLGVRLGLGLNIRAGRNLSWQPEITAWHEFNQVESWVYVAGIGINMGAQPDYSDLEQASSQAPN